MDNVDRNSYLGGVVVGTAGERFAERVAERVCAESGTNTAAKSHCDDTTTFLDVRGNGNVDDCFL